MDKKVVFEDPGRVYRFGIPGVASGRYGFYAMVLAPGDSCLMLSRMVIPDRKPELVLDEQDEPGLSGSGDDPPPESPAPPAPPESPVPPESPTPTDFTIAVADDLSVTLDMPWLWDFLAQALRQIPGEQSVVQLDISVVGDEAMIALHSLHQGIDETTDVLTFPMTEPGEPIEVSIVICADEAKRQAEKRGHTVEKELLLYIIHGVLHCLGFDDREEEDFRRIHAEEDRILEVIGVGKIFHGNDPGDQQA